MKWTKKKVSEIKLNRDNPRTIKDEAFLKLVESVKNFPEMLEIRPVVINRDNVVIGGNQRFKACVEAGFKEIPIVFADTLTEEQEKEFIIRDNIQSGDWDFDLLEGWEVDDLTDWGMDFKIEEQSELYSRKIISPHYEITREKPEVHELYEDTKTKELLDLVKKSKLPEEVKTFLAAACGRFTVLNFERIAEFYAHENKETQEIFEKLALVIIDFDKAIHNGFVEMSQSISDQYYKDHEE